jgi:hypothetical protein
MRPNERHIFHQAPGVLVIDKTFPLAADSHRARATIIRPMSQSLHRDARNTSDGNEEPFPRIQWPTDRGHEKLVTRLKRHRHAPVQVTWCAKFINVSHLRLHTQRARIGRAEQV